MDLEKEIIGNNKLIAEFMGYTKEVYDHGINGEVEIWKNDSIYKGHYHTLQELEYHKSWDWLMPVIEHLESTMKIEFHIYAHYNWKEPNRVTVRTWRNEPIVETYNNSKKQGIYDAIVETIKWCSKNKNKI